MDQKIYNVEETSKYLGLKKATIYAFSSRGKLPKVKFCGRLMFLQKDLDEFIMSNRIEATQ